MQKAQFQEVKLNNLKANVRDAWAPANVQKKSVLKKKQGSN